MSKKTSNKKVKQVASKAKRTPRTEANTPADFRLQSVSDAGLQEPVSLVTSPSEVKENTVVLSLSGGKDSIEFSTERPDIAKRNAIERAKKTALKAEINRIVRGFRDDIDARLKSLSDQIEDQMKPLVHCVADIAVAEKELASRLQDFADQLSCAMNLNDELDPIDISGLFASGDFDIEGPGDASVNDEDIDRINEKLVSRDVEEDDVELLAEIAGKEVELSEKYAQSLTNEAELPRRNASNEPIEEETIN
jgi:hypothetical protein